MFCRQILLVAVTLLILVASSGTAVRSEKLVDPPADEVKVLKLLYVLENSESFKDADTLLSRSYSKLAKALTEEGRVKTYHDGDSKKFCDPVEACDKVLIGRYQQSITITFVCNTPHVKKEDQKVIPSGELNNINEIDGALLIISRVLLKHDERHLSELPK